MDVCHVAREANFAHQFVHMFHKQKGSLCEGAGGDAIKFLLRLVFVSLV